MKASQEPDNTAIAKTISLPADIMSQAADRARSLRRSFSNYVTLLIEEDFARVGQRNEAKTITRKRA